MILPNKNIFFKNSLLGYGYLILEKYKKGDTVSSLWERVREDKNINTFEKYVFTLDLLFILGAINLKEGILVKND